MSLARRFLAALAVVLFASFAFGSATVTPGPASTGAQTLSLAGLAAVSSTWAQTSGNYTVGNRYFTTSARTLYGAKIAWKYSSGTETAVVELWSAAGSLVDTCSITGIVADGNYSCTFSATHSLAPYSSWTLSERKSGGGYVYWTTGGLSIVSPIPTGTPSISTSFGPHLWWQAGYVSAGAGVYPSIAVMASNEAHPIDPILDVT